MIYLDYQATTPLAPEAREAMVRWLGDDAFGNPHSAHRMGRQARAGVELARALTDRWAVRVIFISGDVADAAKNADMAEALVLKPYNGAQILEAVARLA